MFNFKKKQHIDNEPELDEVNDFQEVNEDGNLIYRDSQLGELVEGANITKRGQINVNVISRKALKQEYQVGGVLDQEQNNNWKAWLYLAPALILMAIFLIYPLINTIMISFLKNYNQITGTSEGLTFDNFLQVLNFVPRENGSWNKFFVQKYLKNTFVIVFVTVPLSIVIALLIAVLLNNLRWFKKIFQTIFFLPYVTNAIAVGMVFEIMFKQAGIINAIFHTNLKWLEDPKLQMIPLCINIIWSSIPFKILILLSGLQNVDKQYYNAAKVDATPQWKVLTRITVPALSPQILYLMVTSFIGAFKEYTAVVGLYGGKSGGDAAVSKEVKTVVFYIYEQMKENRKDSVSLASAAAVILFLIILAFTFLQLRLSKRKVNY